MSNKKRPIYLLVQLALLSLALPGIAHAEPDNTLEQWRTKEYKRQSGLDMINAAKAYSLGFTGKGVTVGYLDSGIQATHPEFAGAIAGGFDFNTNTPYTNTQGVDSDDDVPGHGSHVAGIIGARRDGVGMHGVAFNSQLFAVAYVENGNFLSPEEEAAYDDREFSRSWNYLAQFKLPIINNSLGLNDCRDSYDPPCHILEYGSAQGALDWQPLIIDSFRNSVKAGTLMVFATGNETQDHPDFMAGSPHWFPELKDNWLAVTALDEQGNLASYANKCGVAAEWCLSAPGGENPGIYSVNSAGGYAYAGGTSMASPHVAGAAALVKEAFPYFTAYHLQQTLLTTATPLGDPSIYGWGLLNVGKAVQGPAQFTRLFDVDTLGYNSTFANNISGTGGLHKRGSGSLELTGNNSYTGDTTISGGRLAVNGTLASAVTVEREGTLGGSGTVAQVDNYGTLAPGNSVGTLTVSGDYTAHAGSVHELEVGPAGATDRLVVGGAAHIDGTLKLAGGPFRQNVAYSFLDAANGVSGQYSSVAYDMAFLSPTLLYGSSLSVMVERNDTPFAAFAHTGNQKSVAQALDTSSTQPPAAMAELYDTVLNAQSGSVAGYMEQLQGQIHAGTTSALLSNGDLLPRALGKQASSARNTVGKEAVLWAEVIHQQRDLDGDDNSQDVRHKVGGLLLGGDTAIGEQGWRMGASLGYLENRIKLDDRRQSSRSNSYSAALYGTQAWEMGSGSLNLLAGGAYTRHSLDSERSISIHQSETLKADYKAHSIQAFAQLGYRMPVSPRSSVEPYASVNWHQLRHGSFSESGGQAALRGDSQRQNLSTVTLGLRGTTELDLPKTTLSLSAGLGWRHALGDTTPERELAFAALPGSNFRISGAPIAKNAAVAELGAELKAGKSTSFGLNYQGQFGRNQDHAGSLFMKVRF
ncbi:autotransporter domain-containing protein [Alcaligenes nematophilus]|uniref:Autotransporter domain-containing protein n=3 Tax=Alcaligenes TaxID=507 RepID=A0ABU3MVU6_9BURK|nr:autotransporter serine protease [Alcaligenes nematophilus]MDT8465472.1 autotransporter domain-containing protein [Alcaligenes nematophilus]MDT8468573.1 autotransporter domain-containing protein [Alcaligenes nematophilus]MDT8504770.1 autotransporter domain-containing protein [Alcaligenes nematophilus]MDT8524994.1 autotransporter domain-containing protein [Alcaligenes nematophilus]